MTATIDPIEPTPEPTALTPHDIDVLGFGRPETREDPGFTRYHLYVLMAVAFVLGAVTYWTAVAP